MSRLHKRHLAFAALLLACRLAAAAPAAGWDVVPAQAVNGVGASGFDGVVEAVRQTVVAAQVPGAIVQLDVVAGDRVKAGQLLLRIDARAADQVAAAGDAQVASARASLDVAAKDFERQKQLFQKSFISQAALDRAESDFKSAQAQANAQMAQAGAARTQSDFYVVRAPFAGVVAEVPVQLGDMAMPGRALLTLYDPQALRVTAAVPQSVVSRLAAGQMPRAELPGLGAGPWVTPTRLQVLPTVDASTHTAQLRADLPAGLSGATPGMFARLWLPVPAQPSAQGPAMPWVPLKSVVRRAELTGLYVLDGTGQPLLRQVRLGRTEGDRVEVLSGVMPGEKVVTDPQLAARAR